MSILSAAFIYLLLAFAAGFVLGAIRTLWLAPLVTEPVAVYLELPIMALGSWHACRAAFALAKPPPTGAARLAVGALWFAGLQALEAALAGVARGWSVEGWFASQWTPHGLASLAAMAACAAFPLMQRSPARDGGAR